MLAHIHALIHEREAPELPEEFAHEPALVTLHQDLLSLRNALAEFSGGDFSHSVPLRGFMGGTLKALQAAMRHLTWQVQRVAEGDFSQQVEFLGEFSVAFNSMIHQLESSLSELKRKESELTRLASSLAREVEMRSAAMKALSHSEATFKYLAGHDPLTGTMNRRAFLEAVRKEAQAPPPPGCPAPWPCSMWTTSRNSTTPTGTLRAMRPCEPWSRWRAAACAYRTLWGDLAAKNSSFSLQARACGPLLPPVSVFAFPLRAPPLRWVIKK